MVILVPFATACVVHSARSTGVILEGKHYLSTYSMQTHLLTLQHCRPLLPSHVAFLLLVPRSSESSQVGPVPERAGGLHCSPPVHLIAYTQPIWPAPVHRANTAYILANRCFLDLQIEDVLQVVGSLTCTVFVGQLHGNKSERSSQSSYCRRSGKSD